MSAPLSISRRVAAELFLSRPPANPPTQPSTVKGYTLTRRVLAGLLGVRLPPRQVTFSGSGADLHGTHAGSRDAISSSPGSEIGAAVAAESVAAWPAVIRLSHRMTILGMADQLRIVDNSIHDLFLLLESTYRSVMSLVYIGSHGHLADGAAGLEQELESISALVFVLGEQLEGALAQAHALDRSRPLTGDPDLGFALTLAPTISDGLDMGDDLALTIDRVIPAARELTRNTENDLGGVFNRDGEAIREIARELVEEDSRLCVQAITLVSDLVRNVETLQRAANDFMDADLSGLALENVDLIGLRWNVNTVWPNDWTDRIRNTSIEKPEGSGQFVVRPAFDADSAGLAPVGA